MSFEPDHQSQAVTRSQCFSVHSARTSNLEIVHTSLRRSIVKFNEGVERYALDVDYVHAEAADLPIIQVPQRDLHEVSIQHTPKQNLEHLIRIIERMPVPATSYESSMMTCVLRMRQIEHPSHSMLFDSGSDSNTENVWQAPDPALIHEGSEELWMTMSTPVLDSNLMGVELSPRLPLRNLILYSDLSAKAVAFIQLSPSSQEEHVDYVLGILPSMLIWKNGTRRACPLFIYLVIWAPKDYIAHAA